VNNDRINEVFYGRLPGDLSTKLARQRIHWLCSQVESGRVLDLGCSQGVASILLARQGLQVCSVDIEIPALRYAVAEINQQEAAIRQRIHPMLADGARLPYADGSFDAVVFGEVLEHLDEPHKILQEIYRVLRDKGRLVLTTPFGYLPHADHKRTYYLHSVLAATQAFFDVVHLDVQGHHFIRLIGQRSASGAGNASETGLRGLEAQVESEFLGKEERYVKDLNQLRESLTAANRKYREATALVATLKERIRRAAAGEAVQDPEELPLVQVLRRDLEGVLQERDRAREEVGQRVAELGRLRSLLERLRQGQEQTQLEQSRVQEQLMERTSELELERRALKALKQEQQREWEAFHRERVSVGERVNTLREHLSKANADKLALRERYTNAVHSFQSQKERNQSQKKRNEQLDKEVRTLRYHLRVVDNSRAWKIVRLYWRFREEFLGGNWAKRRRFLSDVGAIVRRRLVKPKQEIRFEEKLEAFLKRATSQRSSTVVFMFSGTTYIQEHRGNRPIRLSRVLLKRKIPVLFSYWRWRASEAMPPDSDPLLLQSPIDLTMRYMERIARHDFGDKKKIFVITFPHISCARFVNIFRSLGWVTLYDVRDDWEEFHKVGAARWYNKNQERYIANNADVVTAVSGPLQEKIRGYMEAGEVHLSPNALDTRYPTGRKVQVRAVGDGPPVIGYVGHLTASWFNWDALLWAARQRPDWTFEIVGHSMPEDLDLPPNLQYLGPMDYREILTTTRRWRAALIPFQECLLSDGVDPIKVYEYLAMGLPVVSFRMPQIHDYPYVFIAKGKEGFVACIEQALQVEMDPQVIRDFLAVNRWQDRVDQLLAWRAESRETGDFRDLAKRESGQ